MECFTNVVIRYAHNLLGINNGNVVEQNSNHLTPSRDTIAEKLRDTAAMEKIMQQAVLEAVEKARKLGFLKTPIVQEGLPNAKHDFLHIDHAGLSNRLPDTATDKLLQLGIEPKQTEVNTVNTLLDEIKQLGIAERLQLVEDLWDSVAVRASEFPISESQKVELDRRLVRHHQDPLRGITLDQIAQKLGVAV